MTRAAAEAVFELPSSRSGWQVTLLRAKFKDLLSGGVGPRGGQVDVLSIDGFQVCKP